MAIRMDDTGNVQTEYRQSYEVPSSNVQKKKRWEIIADNRRKQMKVVASCIASFILVD
jgi:hypothetical protein